jgi:hypothetical protein
MLTPPRVPGLRGLLPPKPPGQRFAIGWIHDYLLAIPPPPIYPIDVSAGLKAFPMYGNGPDGNLTVHGGVPVSDCSFAARQVYRRIKAANTGATFVPETTDQVVTEYLAYNNGQDLGACVADVLLAWFKAGTILGFAPVDHTSPTKCDSAMLLFHGLYSGAILTNDADSLFAKGEAWTLNPGEIPASGDGHCLTKTGSDGIATDHWACWTGIQQSTLAWTAACINEAWVIITTEDEAGQVDLVALTADIKALGGTAG